MIEGQENQSYISNARAKSGRKLQVVGCQVAMSEESPLGKAGGT